MVNNNILRRLRCYAFDFNDAQMGALFGLAKPACTEARFAAESRPALRQTGETRPDRGWCRWYFSWDHE
ncbi:MAG: DUF1456 family protein [Deltaproteobacteria bacterium]|nr:DUF1456 family protein [Deltaproteobacteria bacterium]